MKQDARIISYGYWGERSPAYAFALTGAAMMADSMKYGRVRGVRLLRTDRAADRNDERVRPICLASQTIFPLELNTKEAWSSYIGGEDYLDECTNPFGGGIPGLAHTSNALSAYRGITVPANTAHTLRLYLYKAPEDLNYPLLVVAWADWQLHITKSRAFLARCTPAWTQENETLLIALLGIEDPTIEEQEQIEELRESLYADMADVELNGDNSDNSISFYELEFLPEPGGKVTVFCNGRFAGECDHTTILKSRKPGIVWGESELVLRRNGGQYVWQCGYPHFVPAGQIRWVFSANSATGATVFNKVTHEPPGTSITLNEALTTYEFVADFSTNNPRQTPFLYLAQALKEAGEREGSTEQSWDSEDHVDSQGHAPILEIDVNCEGEMRRRRYMVQVRDIDGQTFASMGDDLQALENRVVDLYIGNPTLSVIYGGIVRSATLTDLAWPSGSVPRSTAFRPDSTVQMEICDPWTLLEEFELRGGEIVGDGLRLGALLKRCLRLIGLPWDRMSLIPTEGSAAGPILPKAALGETWAVVNNEQTLADFIYYLIERFGMGKILWCGPDGLWRFDNRRTEVKEFQGVEVDFSPDIERNDSEGYPGRFAMLQPIDLARDTTEFFNVFEVEGKNPYTDEPLVRMYTIHESISDTSNSPKRIGRVKRMRRIIDENLRTADEVNFTLRSLVEMYGLTPDVISFPTYFHSFLHVGDRVKAVGGEWFVWRINSADWKNDEMSLALRRAD